jgi:hypothetical protein
LNTIHNIDFGNNPDKGYGNPVYDASSIIRTSDDNGITWKSKLYSGKDGQTADGRTNRLGGVAFIE